MLRDFVYTLDPSLIERTLARFDIVIPEERGAHALIEFQVLSPDSFIWRFLIDGAVYYMYAEDYVEGLEYVRGEISAYAIDEIELEFIKAKQQKEFEDTDPVKNATVYKPPEDYDKMKQFAVSSGYDFVFLCRSSEDASGALFNT
jgi:hypothetical protein